MTLGPAGADVSVRPAGAADAAAMGQVQARAWRSAYAAVLPPDVLDALRPAELAAAWSEALAAPPAPGQVLLVALEGARVVGLAASGPDPGGETGADAELHLLAVDPGAGRRGHGTRLLAATVDLLREQGVRRLRVWVNVPGSDHPADGSDDEALTRLLTASGWAPDGASRALDLRGDGAVVVPQVRLHASI